MRLNDANVKMMYQKVNETHTQVAVIGEKIDNIENHLSVQNSRLCKHAGAIEKLKIGQTELKTRMWILLLLGSSGGGFIGYILGSVLLPLVGG